MDRDQIALLGIFGVPALLLIAHYLFRAAIHAYIGAHSPDRDLLRAYATAAYHLNATHLWTNISVFVVITLAIYILAVYLGQTEWYILTYWFSVLLTPVLTTSVLYRVFDAIGASGIVLGFSAVVSSFVALLFLTLLLAARSLWTPPTVFLLGWCLISAWSYLVLNGQKVALTGIEMFLLTASFLMPVGGIAYQVLRYSRRVDSIDWRVHSLRIGGLMLGILVFGLVIQLFLPFSAHANRLTMWSHFVGLVLGFLNGVLAFGLEGLFTERNRWDHGFSS